MQAGGQAVVDVVDGSDGFLKCIDTHDAEDGREVFRQMELAAGNHTRTDTRCPEPITQVARLEHPVLALSQGGQASHGLLIVRHDDGTDLRIEGRRQSHTQRRGRIDELTRDT